MQTNYYYTPLLQPLENAVEIKSWLIHGKSIDSTLLEPLEQDLLLKDALMTPIMKTSWEDTPCSSDLNEDSYFVLDSHLINLPSLLLESDFDYSNGLFSNLSSLTRTSSSKNEEAPYEVDIGRPALTPIVELSTSGSSNLETSLTLLSASNSLATATVGCTTRCRGSSSSPGQECNLDSAIEVRSRTDSPHEDERRDDADDDEYTVEDSDDEEYVVDPPKRQSTKPRRRPANTTTPYHSGRLTKSSVKVFTQVFAVTPYPDTRIRKLLAERLDMNPRAVQIWFQNKRQHLKAMGVAEGLRWTWCGGALKLNFSNWVMGSSSDKSSSIRQCIGHPRIYF
ncbi:hypothetical protein SmJEL517_g04891 [Synchytrium microbalum]|uniref:Homeobox domain-containing protein n=1 Tax=Synchytrium microbalum TaxID=1806994 RepID=A0A507BXG8_9FUNG|nr:uncharacterized protein SmJEL517_g04891 [Synchytrium microbalum]TPX31828.1 hypothetical protein SmJEL517_g04891 [Synchytrium microbalum]